MSQPQPLPKYDFIYIFRSGLLGDTIVSLPALWWLRQAFPSAKIIYIWQKTPNSHHVSATSILENSGLVDEFLCDVLGSNLLARIFSRFKLLLKLRFRKIDLALILEAAHWPDAKRRRFLQLAGAKKILGPQSVLDPRLRLRAPRQANGRLARVKHIADQLLEILRPLGITIPPEHSGKMTLPVGAKDKQRVDNWCRDKQLDNVKMVMVGPCSNMPSKRWPLENFAAVLKALVAEFDIMPVIMGGAPDREAANWLIKEVGRGEVAAGEFNISEGVHLLSKARFYLGNDTGIMHMAAAAQVPCVAVFSSFDVPGLWEPYGNQHTVFRTDIDCAGCFLKECIERKMECIKSITSEQVLEACRNYLLAGNALKQGVR